MGKILLTSSQVSVIVSFSVIVLCTIALFVSGYVIQQRTLQQLRVAIKPRPARSSPKVYLPDRFKTTTTELEDGTVVYLESEVERDANGQLLIEARETKRGEGFEMQIDERTAIIERLKVDIARLSSKGSTDTSSYSEETETKRNKVELKDGEVEHPDPAAKSDKPLTRAQRRKLIKEEIRKFSPENEDQSGYQRRLW